jgi:peptide/nickel transport system permease protein
VSHRSRVIAFRTLAAIHVVLLFAGFFAPDDPAEQNRYLPYAPPSRLRFIDSSGTLHLRGFVYARVPEPGTYDRYMEDTTRMYPVILLARGAEYTVLPGIRSNLHLFGVESPARLSLLGTDGYGRDVLSRLLHGGRLSLTAGLLATLCSLLVAALLGTLAGFHGGIVDQVIMRVADLFMAVPWLFLLFAVRAALPLQLDTRHLLLLLIAVVGIVGWARPARLVRAIVLSARERTYVLVARGFGAPRRYVLRRHVLPHAYGVVLTQAALLVPQYVLAEVTLSFLGLGVGEPVPSWGNMLGALQQYHVLTSYWWMFAPAAALITMTLGYHLLTGSVEERFRTVLV